MDDDAFDEMLFGVSLIEDSSQESLTDEAHFFEDLLETPETNSILTSPPALGSSISSKSLERTIELNEDALMLDAGQSQLTSAGKLLETVQKPHQITRNR